MTDKMEAMKCPRCKSNRVEFKYEAMLGLKFFCHDCGHHETIIGSPDESFDEAFVRWGFLSKSTDKEKSDINILGTKYTIKYRKPEEDSKLNEDCDLLGYTDTTSKEIVIAIIDDDIMSVSDKDWINRKVLRHELVHAFMAESGLDSCNGWADNEELVEWIARQFPKMYKAFQSLGCEKE